MQYYMLRAYRLQAAKRTQYGEIDWKRMKRQQASINSNNKNDAKKTNGFSFFLLSACCDEEYAIKTMEYAKREIIYESSESGQNVFYIKL